MSAQSQDYQQRDHERAQWRTSTGKSRSARSCARRDACRMSDPRSRGRGRAAARVCPCLGQPKAVMTQPPEWTAVEESLTGHGLTPAAICRPNATHELGTSGDAVGARATPAPGVTYRADPRRHRGARRRGLARDPPRSSNSGDMKTASLPECAPAFGGRHGTNGRGSK